MKNLEEWRPSKYVPVKGYWKPSPDPTEIGRGSRLMASIQAELYPRVLRKYATGRLLDLGCGKVPCYGMYKNLVAESVCVDWPSSLHGTDHVDQCVDLNEHLPFADNAFDTILSTDVLEHVGKPDVAWKEIARVLKPSGKALISVPFLYCVHEQPHDYQRWTAFKLRDVCAANGLTVLELEPYGGGLEVVLDIIGKHLTRHKALSAIHLTIAKGLRKIGPIKSLSEDQKHDFPMGYMLVAEKSAPGKAKPPPTM